MTDNYIRVKDLIAKLQELDPGLPIVNDFGDLVTNVSCMKLLGNILLGNIFDTKPPVFRMSPPKPNQKRTEVVQIFFRVLG